MKNTLLILFLSLSFSLTAQTTDEACKFVGEIALPSLRAGAFTACIATGNPLACDAALYIQGCLGTPSCYGLTKAFTEKSCKVTVEYGTETIKVIGETSAEFMFELDKVWQALNTVEGIIWLEKKLVGF